ncbi:hypothetical protein ADIARSV_1379 [Arcticibacter svalbardensis MN12-7]|uniref:Uncharacterized protein n=1 Tax=Arcticibacter svalbardensis MN12-7 TaxID=1150600 RepID=R9GUU3_9SPHI|nr:hypothetical protein ADIARSV_1379 [Arcticibacter svalbardensis MN12-7]
MIGQPNNPSHSSVFYIDEEVRLKLAEFAEKVEDIDIDAIHNKIEQKKITLFAQIIK